MSLNQLLSLNCTIERRTAGGEDDYGNDTVTVTPLDTVCELQQAKRDEPDSQGELSATDWRLYLPAGTDIDTSDTVIVNDLVFEVVGDPWQARNPRTRTLSHVEATVRKTGEAAVGS
jgi:hypothetical protein